jgi:dihydroorotate dehydrogenase
VRRVFRRLKPYGDYFVVNVSCPNTPEEFEESDPEHLRALLGAVVDEDDADRPLLVKVGPDQDRAALESLVAVLDEFPVDGVVATNTTTRRPALDSPHAAETGGLSGAPLAERATETVRTLAAIDDSLTLIGVGGVDSAERAYRKIRAGASLVQLYTGFVYGGPATARRINRNLLDALRRDGFDSVEDAVGVDVPGAA